MPDSRGKGRLVDANPRQRAERALIKKALALDTAQVRDKFLLRSGLVRGIERANVTHGREQGPKIAALESASDEGCGVAESLLCRDGQRGGGAYNAFHHVVGGFAGTEHGRERYMAALGELSRLVRGFGELFAEVKNFLAHGHDGLGDLVEQLQREIELFVELAHRLEVIFPRGRTDFRGSGHVRKGLLNAFNPRLDGLGGAAYAVVKPEPKAELVAHGLSYPSSCSGPCTTRGTPRGTPQATVRPRERFRSCCLRQRVPSELVPRVVGPAAPA